MPDGFEAGTHNLPGVAGLLAGIEFINDTGLFAIHQHGHALLGQLEQALKAIPGVTVYGPADLSGRCSVISFTASAVDTALLATELDYAYDIAVRSGLHCAPLAHRTLGTLPGGTVRVSPGWFTTREEMTLFTEAVVQCISKIRASAA
jgi:selenocysteine lyase/cysteine desulfurase